MASLTNTVTSAGQRLGTGDRDALFLKIFAGEVLTAFTRTSQMMDKHIVRTISSGN